MLTHGRRIAAQLVMITSGLVHLGFAAAAFASGVVTPIAPSMPTSPGTPVRS